MCTSQAAPSADELRFMRRVAIPIKKYLPLPPPCFPPPRPFPIFNLFLLLLRMHPYAMPLTMHSFHVFTRQGGVRRKPPTAPATSSQVAFSTRAATGADHPFSALAVGEPLTPWRPHILRSLPFPFSSPKHCIPASKYQTPNTKHRAPNTLHPTLSTMH